MLIYVQVHVRVLYVLSCVCVYVCVCFGIVFVSKAGNNFHFSLKKSYQRSPAENLPSHLEKDNIEKKKNVHVRCGVEVYSGKVGVFQREKGAQSIENYMSSF